MDEAARARLNAVNRAFYAATAAEFDRSRATPWPGWTRLLGHLDAAPVDGVLDLGCGNGRFGVALARARPDARRYHGVDNNPALLDAARAALAGYPALTATFTVRDLVERPPALFPETEAGGSGTGDALVVAFGLLHHLPGADARRDFVRAMAARVRPGGLLAFACWRFYDFPRFRARVVPWPADLAALVEPGDYLLDWRAGATRDTGAAGNTFPLRYCHHVDDAEHEALVDAARAAGLTEIDRYRADGAGDALNAYSVLRR